MFSAVLVLGWWGFLLCSPGVQGCATIPLAYKEIYQFVTVLLTMFARFDITEGVRAMVGINDTLDPW